MSNLDPPPKSSSQMFLSDVSSLAEQHHIKTTPRHPCHQTIVHTLYANLKAVTLEYHGLNKV